MLPAIPFLVLPLAELARPERARGWRLAAGALGAYSIIVVEVSAAVTPLFDQRLPAPLTQWVLPRVAGLNVDPQHPERVAAAVSQALLHTAPLFLTARMQPNWGQWTALPGMAQVWLLALIVGALLLWYARGAQQALRMSPAVERAAHT
jgi:hypothetical protein